MLKKQIKQAFRKKIYLLGVDHDGIYRWLEEPSWDCGWYWGFGYIESYTNNKQPQLSRDIREHIHWDSTFIYPNGNAFQIFASFFENTTLTDNELWKLCDYMQSYYALKETAKILSRGYGSYTSSAKLDELFNEDIVKHINNDMLPALFKKIDDLFQEVE